MIIVKMTRREINKIIKEELEMTEPIEDGNFITLPYPEHLENPITGRVIEIHPGDDIDVFINLETMVYVSDRNDLEDEMVERFSGIISDVVDLDDDGINDQIVIDTSRPRKLKLDSALDAEIVNPEPKV